MSNNENNQNNKIVTIASGVILILIIALLIGFSFVKSKYQFEITTPIIILLTFLVIIFLSNTFDNFQIGRIISLKRNVSEYKEKNEKLENDKNELIKQIINQNVQSQNSTNVNWNVPLDLFKNSISIQPANEEEIKNNISQEDNEIPNETANEIKSSHRRIDKRKLEKFAIEKYSESINCHSIIRDVKLSNKFGDNDPISNKDVIFDGFFNDDGIEKFIEVNQNSTSIFFDRLYVMLNKIYIYNVIKNSKANLTLIIPKLPEDSSIRVPLYGSIDRLKNVFSPAITIGLLNIWQVEISNEELNDLMIE